MSHLEVTKVLVPYECAEHTYNFLRAAGLREVEGVALWAGRREGDTFELEYSIIPKQKAYKSDEGLLYRVEGDELHRINVLLHEKKLVLIAQIHSHPGVAYHSDTDDAFPIVTKEGSLSIVVPDYASRPMSIKDWAIFRLKPKQGWVELTEEDVNNLIEIQQ